MVARRARLLLRSPPRPAHRRVRRSSADVEAVAAKILAYVKASRPAARRDRARARVETAGLKLPVQVLFGTGRLRTEGRSAGRGVHAVFPPAT